jgi:hypothetical protein
MDRSLSTPTLTARVQLHSLEAAEWVLRNISAADPDKVRRHLPTDLGDMSVEIRDQPVVCRRFVPTGSVQGLVPSERTSTGEILGDTRRLRRARNVPEARCPFPRGQPGARRDERSGRAKTSLREFPLRLGSPRRPPPSRRRSLTGPGRQAPRPCPRPKDPVPRAVHAWHGYGGCASSTWGCQR